MPNWCNNYIEVTGTKSQLDKYGLLDSFSFEKMRPMPKELEGTVSPGDSPNWYDWRIENWGTKWDIDAEEPYVINEVDIKEGTWDRVLTVAYGFDTAWGPPIELYEYMQTLGLQVEAEYYEGGCAFYGYWNNENGEQTHSFNGWGDLPENICERFGLEEEDFIY